MGDPGVVENLGAKMTRRTKGDAVFSDIAAVGHVVAISDVVRVQFHEVLDRSMKFVICMAALSILARLATHHAPVAIAPKHGGAKRCPDLFFGDHMAPSSTQP